jgi:hypothetical protein
VNSQNQDEIAEFVSWDIRREKPELMYAKNAMGQIFKHHVMAIN